MTDDHPYKPRSSGRPLTPDVKGTALMCPACGKRCGEGFVLVEDPAAHRPWSIIVVARTQLGDGVWKAPVRAPGARVALQGYAGAPATWPLDWQCTSCAETVSVIETDAPKIGVSKKRFVVHRSSEVLR